MMYFREDAKRPMSISREQFEENWDRIFGKNGTDGADGADKIDACCGCSRKCFNVKDKAKTVRPYFTDRSSRIVLVGFCSIKRGYVLEVGEILPFNVIYFDYENTLGEDDCSTDYAVVSNGCDTIISYEHAKKKNFKDANHKV